MRSRKRQLCACFCVILLFLIVSSVSANTVSTKLFYNSSLSAGMTTQINAALTSAGYTSTLAADPTVLILRMTLMGYHKVVFIHTHGSTTPLLVCSNGNLYPAAVTSSSNTLSYLSSCYSAYPQNSSSSFRGRMESLGVPMTVGFRSTISAVGSSDGIHYFNWDTIRRLANGYQLGHAITIAKTRTYNLFNGYYGSENVEYAYPLEELD